MIICGYEIDAIEIDGLVKKSHKQQRPRREFDCNKVTTDSLRKLMELHIWLSNDGLLGCSRYRELKGCDFRIWVEVIQKNLHCSERTAYNYGYTLWMLRH